MHSKAGKRFRSGGIIIAAAALATAVLISVGLALAYRAAGRLGAAIFIGILVPAVLMGSAARAARRQ